MQQRTQQRARTVLQFRQLSITQKKPSKLSPHTSFASEIVKEQTVKQNDEEVEKQDSIDDEEIEKQDSIDDEEIEKQDSIDDEEIEKQKNADKTSEIE